MKYRLEVRQHDFFLAGRDEEKSHVIVELAKPTPAEVVSHGYLVTIAEIQNAAPRTIQMLTTWIEFLVQNYYDNKENDAALRFESVLEKLNGQSALYLRQHPEEKIHLLAAVVIDGTIHVAARGRPAAYLFYHHDGIWKYVEVISTEETPSGQLFSQVASGQLRPGDRLFLGSAHLTDFFTADRIAKISEGKPMEEVAGHLERILQELQSDFSFAGVWFSTIKIQEAEKPEECVGRAGESMNNLFKKTNGTATVLAPPMITWRQDRIITTLLLWCKRGLWQGVTGGVAIGKTGWRYWQNKRSATGSNFSETKNTSWRERLQKWRADLQKWYSALPGRRRSSFVLGVGVATVAVVAIITLAVISTVRSTNSAALQTLSEIQSKLQAADNAFTYQNENNARALLQEATATFDTLPSRWQDHAETLAARDLLQTTTNKIWRRKNVAPTVIGNGLTGAQLAVANGLPIVLKDTAIKTWRNGAENPLAELAGAQKIWFDSEGKRLVILGKNRQLATFDTTGKAGGDLKNTWLPENSALTAATFYNGRFYVYDGASKMIYRYDAKGAELGNGKKWLVGGDSPTGVVKIAAESSLWLLTSSGNIMRFTAGKLMPFHLNGLEPAAGALTDVWANADAKSVYFLDQANQRIIATNRNGNLQNQLILPAGVKLTTFALDEKETTVFGITDDGRLLRFAAQ